MHAPLAGIEQGGWKLVYNDKPNAFLAASEGAGSGLELSYSLGVALSKNGDVEDVIPDSPAAKAGIAPRMKILAVNERRWSKNVMVDAIRAAAQSQQPIQLLVENAQAVRTYAVAYFEGLRYPHLEQVANRPVVVRHHQRRLKVSRAGYLFDLGMSFIWMQEA